MAKGVNEVDSWAVASYVDCRLPLGTLSLDDRDHSHNHKMRVAYLGKF
jgi:hypothetical protein